MLIRAAAADDVAVLAALRWEFRTAEAAPSESRDAFVARFCAQVTPALAQGRWRAWVAVAGGGDVVGHVFAATLEKLPNPVPEAETHLYISNLYVRPEHRGQGTGHRLFAAALDGHRDVDAVILWSRPEADGLYRYHGFTPSPDLLQRRDG